MTTRRIWLVCVAVVVTGCAVLPRSRQTVTSYLVPAFAARWVLGTVVVEHLTAADRIRRMVDEAALLAAADNGIVVVETGDSPDVVADLWVSEREITRELRTLNSIAVTVTLRSAAEGNVLLRAAFAEETPDTLVSFYHLYDVLDTLCRSVARRIRAEAKVSSRRATASSP